MKITSTVSFYSIINIIFIYLSICILDYAISNLGFDNGISNVNKMNYEYNNTFNHQHPIYLLNSNTLENYNLGGSSIYNKCKSI